MRPSLPATLRTLALRSAPAFVVRSALTLLALSPALAAAQPGPEVRLDPEARRALNVFFSNFAEAEVQPFRQGAVPHLALVRFGVLHHVINAPERIEHVPGPSGDHRLRASDVGAAVTKYFGVRLPHRATTARDSAAFAGADGHDGYHRAAYADGYYAFTLGDGAWEGFAQVHRLFDVGGGEFVAWVGVYAALGRGDEVYDTPLETLRAYYGEDFYAGPEMQARIRRVREGGRERYVLLEWLQRDPAP